MSLIDRQAAIDALRYAQHRFTVADEAGGIGTVKWSEDVIYFAAAENVLNDLPSAQPEIIRCKDCKHYQFADNRAFGMPVKMCKWFGFEDVDDDDFCSRAERREE